MSQDASGPAETLRGGDIGTSGVPLKLAFAGTPEFAATALAALLEAGHPVGLVLTQADRPAGRGLKLQASPVKALALRHGIEVVQPRGLRAGGRYAEDAAAAEAALVAARADVLVVAAYGLILPRRVLEVPRLGCLNIHASLLPRWRGAAPIQRAIEAGDATTGITIMQMDEGLDTGPMLLEAALPIAPDETSARLHDRLAALGARLVVEALARLDAIVPRPQPAAGASYAAKIEKHEAAIDWHQSAAVIERRLRAFDPFPGASSVFDGETVKLWRGSAVERDGDGGGRSGAPGEVLAAGAAGLRVACGEGALLVHELQRPGGRRIDAAAFLAGRSVRVGARFEPRPVVGS